MPELNVPPELVPPLKKLWSAGLSAIECGIELGLVGEPNDIREAIIRVIRARISINWWTDERVETLKNLNADGKSCGVIAKEMGNSRSAILGKLRRLRLADGRKSGIHETLPRTPRQPRQLPRRRFVTTEPDPRFAVDGINGSPAPDDLAIPVEQRKTLMQLTDKICRWPVGDPHNPAFFFCGAATYDETPYCFHHAKRAFIGIPQMRATNYRRTA